MRCAHDFYPSWQCSRCSPSSLKVRRCMRGAVVEVEEAAVVREGAVAAEACRGLQAPRGPQAPHDRQTSHDRQAFRDHQAPRDRQTPRDLRAALGCRDLREEEAYRVHPVAAAVSRGPHSSPPAVPRDRVVGACPPLHQSGPRVVNVHPAEGAPRSFHQAIAPAQRIDLPSLRVALRHVPEAGWPSGHRKGQWVPAQQIDLRAARPVVPRSFPPNPAPGLPNVLAGNPASAPARAT
jgi:hypothetical protein